MSAHAIKLISTILFIALCACKSTREKRGDWMEHLNYKQFNFQPLDPWSRHNYYSEEELREQWNEIYKRITNEKKNNNG